MTNAVCHRHRPAAIPANFVCHSGDAKLPQLYPQSFAAAAAEAAGAALAQEIIARFGLLTIVVYLLRWRGVTGHPWIAPVFIAAFSTLATYLFLSKFGLPAKLEGAHSGLILAGTFFLQWLYGEIYLRKGLLAAICLHLGMGLKFFFYIQ